MLIDLHVHSYLSRGCNLTPQSVLNRAETFGLDGVAFTETNTLDGCDELLDMAQTSKIKIFVGLELATDRGQYLCFFPDPMKVPEPVQLWGTNREKAWNADECLPKMKSLGAAIIAARPYDRDFPNPANEYVRNLKLLSGIEVYNPKTRLGFNEMAVESAQIMHLPGCSGSDAKDSVDEIGFGATVFTKPFKTQKEFVAALLEGDFHAVQMGELPSLRSPGDAKADVISAKKKKKRKWMR
jgi:predicted metal-dependent phosphoesterase TrpH